MVNPRRLRAQGLARKKGVPVKILGAGELTRRLVVDGRQRLRDRPREDRGAGRRGARTRRGRRGEQEAEVMANPLVDIFRVKELRDRILFTLGMLVIFRLGTILPVPGINISALKLYFGARGVRRAGHRGLPGLLRRRRVQELLDLHADDHALHLHVDHHAAADDRVPEAEEDPGGGGREEEDQPLDPLRHGPRLHHPVLHGDAVRQQHPGRHHACRRCRSP